LDDALIAAALRSGFISRTLAPRDDAWSAHTGDVLYIAGIAVVGSFIAAMTFRWE